MATSNSIHEADPILENDPPELPPRNQFPLPLASNLGYRKPSIFENHHNPSTFLITYQAYANLLGWTEAQQVQAIPLFLSSPSLLWYQHLNEATKTSFPLFKTAFLSKFQPTQFQMDLHQQQDETISDFKLRLMQNCMGSGIPEPLQLQIFCQGLHPNIKETVALSCPSTIEEAEKIAMIKSSFLQPSPIPSTNPTSNNTIPATLLSSFEKLFATQNKLITDSFTQNPSRAQSYLPPKQYNIPHSSNRFRSPHPSNRNSHNPSIRHNYYTQPRQSFSSSSSNVPHSQPQPNGNYPIICFNCQQPGHKSPDCPNRSSKYPLSTISKIHNNDSRLSEKYNQEILFLKQQLCHERIWKDKYSTLASTLRTQLDHANNVHLLHNSNLAKRTLGTPLGDVIQENIPPTNHLCTLVPTDSSSSQTLSRSAGKTFISKYPAKYFLLCIVLMLGIFVISNSKPDFFNVLTILHQTYTSLISKPMAYSFCFLIYLIFC